MATGTLAGAAMLPYGTVSIELDHDRGVLRIYREANPHPEDWAVAQSIACLIAKGGWDFYLDEGTEICEVRLSRSYYEVR